MKIKFHLKRFEAQDLAYMLSRILNKSSDDDIIVTIDTLSGEYMNGFLSFWTYKEGV